PQLLALAGVAAASADVRPALATQGWARWGVTALAGAGAMAALVLAARSEAVLALLAGLALLAAARGPAPRP
ncbi:MAG: hypothetical protein NW201_03210, partial [Gemmatimonadales bacterium]|nr:hypothetical protein [Gemmatimonadales bacterium]